MLLLLLNTRKNVKIIRNRALNKIVGFSPQQSLSYKLTLIKKNKKRQKKIHEIVVEVEMKLKINLNFFFPWLIWTQFRDHHPFSLQN